MDAVLLAFALAARLCAAGPDVIDLRLQKPLEPFVLKLYGVDRGGGAFVKKCSRDTTFWIFHKDLFTTCAQADAALRSTHPDLSEAVLRRQGGGCSDLPALPEAISGTFGASRFMLTKQFSPCSRRDSASLARRFGKAFVTREVEENIESCLIFDDRTFPDTSSAAFQERAKALGRSAHQVLPDGVSVLPKDSSFASSPFVHPLALAACLDRKAADSAARSLDSNFRVVRVLGK